ncbi:single-stranded DNA-binding protein [Methylacidiphilum caldifontis]|uniref:Single-stranded DNA-binding protein n=1 Tax=Methylacidiphilum caldifontis TaxID=2795386 RepID=A0A4Y8PHF6_9BACT|nr:single-stranded DNA-binding protein [Methylacidiphilum caldifontis]TFE73027.1 hypothetical protein A7Q10_10520 [Methylacidiphilum caldifontis]
MLVGSICQGPIPRLHDPDLDKASIRFQLAVSAGERVKQAEHGVDYPWVYAYGALAQRLWSQLQVGQYVFVAGRYHTRHVPGKWPDPIQFCPWCGFPIAADTPDACPRCQHGLSLPDRTVVEVVADVVDLLGFRDPTPMVGDQSTS